ncbi:MAG: transposase [Planctomycetaceae bacterium]|nr:transposase [Planctomycetaceae bacterium]
MTGQWPTYGYRRLTRRLHRQGHPVNAKRVLRRNEESRIYHWHAKTGTFRSCPMAVERAQWRPALFSPKFLIANRLSHEGRALAGHL